MLCFPGVTLIATNLSNAFLTLTDGRQPLLAKPYHTELKQSKYAV